MSYQRPKWKSYTLPSWDQIHILRDPPKSIHTRKKERVDISDVLYMVRNDDSRINEGVNWLARGTNPMTDVSYNNSGGGSRTTTMSNMQASLPYKIMKDGAFRPPLYTQEDILPLSRMRRPQPAVYTNPGVIIPFVNPDFNLNYDKPEVLSAIDVKKNNYIIPPTAVYKIEMPKEMFNKNSITDKRLQVSVQAPINKDIESQNNMNKVIDVKHYTKDVLLNSLPANFSVIVYNPHNKNFSEVKANIKDKLNIVAQTNAGNPISLTRDDGTPIKVKDYKAQVVQSAMGGSSLVIQVQNNPDLNLDRNLPVYAVGTNVSGHKNQERFTDKVNLENPRLTSATSSIYSNVGRKETIHDNPYKINLRRMANFGSFENYGSAPRTDVRNLPTLRGEGSDLDRNIRMQMIQD